jgi:transposase
MKRPQICVIKALREFLTAKTIAKVFAVCERTVFKWSALPDDHSPLKRGKKPKFTEGDVEKILKIVEEKPHVTLKEILELLETDTHVSTLQKFMKRSKITKKRGHCVFREANADAQGAFRDRFSSFRRRIFAVDESHVCMNNPPRYGWAPRGRRAKTLTRCRKGQRFTLVLGVSNDGEVVHKLVRDRFSSSDFCDFLCDFDFEESTIVMDTASIHKATHVLRRAGRQTVEEVLDRRRAKAEFLPPYSPNLNPAEMCFNIVKTRLRKSDPESVEDLERVVSAAVEECSHHAKKMFEHCFLSSGMV